MKHLIIMAFLISCFYTDIGAADTGLDLAGRGGQQDSGLQLKMAGYQADVFWGMASWLEILGSYAVDQYNIEYIDRTDRCSETFVGAGVGFKASYYFIDLLVGKVAKNFVVTKETDLRGTVTIGAKIPFSLWQSRAVLTNAILAVTASQDKSSGESVKGALLGIRMTLPSSH